MDKAEFNIKASILEGIPSDVVVLILNTSPSICDVVLQAATRDKEARYPR